MTAKGVVRSYVNYAKNILKNFDIIEISATGNAIVKALMFVEMAKREIEFELHQ